MRFPGHGLTTTLAILPVLALGFASPSMGVELDANILGVYTDTTFSQLDNNFWVSSDGDQAVADLQPGQGLLVGIDVANVNQDSVHGIFSTLHVDSTRIIFLGSIANQQVLLEPGFAGNSISPVAPVDVKINSPGGTDEWVQVMLHHRNNGTEDPGPDLNAVQIFFEVPASVGTGPMDFTLDLTAGDGVDACCMMVGASFNSAVLHVPEPSLQSALLPGLCALAIAGRRRRHKEVYPGGPPKFSTPQM
jgi:hypothetical protein